MSGYEYHKLKKGLSIYKQRGSKNYVTVHRASVDIIIVTGSTRSTFSR